MNQYQSFWSGVNSICPSILFNNKNEKSQLSFLFVNLKKKKMKRLSALCMKTWFHLICFFSSHIFKYATYLMQHNKMKENMRRSNVLGKQKFYLIFLCVRALVFIFLFFLLDFFFRTGKERRTCKSTHNTIYIYTLWVYLFIFHNFLWLWWIFFPRWCLNSTYYWYIV